MRKTKLFKGLYDRLLGPIIPRKMKAAILSGLCGALSSALGKFALGGTSLVEKSWNYCVNSGVMGGQHECLALITLIRMFCFGLLMFGNAIMIYYFMEAMKKNSSLTVTVVSTAANYLASGALGLLVFGEPVGSYWLLGSMGICLGIWVIAYSQEKIGTPTKGI
jgi:drug/metabolite transporter (DMT)-like permease